MRFIYLGLEIIEISPSSRRDQRSDREAKIILSIVKF